MAQFTTHLRLRLGDELTEDARFNLNRLDQLGASGLYDASGNLTLRSATDIVLRPGSGSGGSFSSNHKLTSFSINATTLVLNNDIVFSGSWSLPWARVSKSGASVTDFSDFTTQVSNNSDVSASTDHLSDTNNPHATTAAQVGAYTTTAVDAALAGKAALVHTHTASQITDFNTAVGASPTASTLSAHTADSSIHFTKASISHTSISDIGNNTHAQIDSHIANTSNPHAVTASQLGVYTIVQSDALLSAHVNDSSVHGVSGNVVGTTDIQALTNKNVDGSQNTITNLTNTAIHSSAAIAGTKISPDFGNQVINTQDGVTFEEGGYKAKLRAAQSGMSANVTWELPPADGTIGQVLTTNGSGNLEWAAVLTSTLAENSVFVGDATDTLQGTDTAAQGDILADTTTGLTIKAGVIINADVNAAAAVALSKLATVTADRALVSTAGGVISASAVTATELGYVSGATSNIQAQLDAGVIPPGAADTVLTSNGSVASYNKIVNANVAAAAAIAVNKLAAVTASRALASDASGFVSATSVTSTELGYVSGVTSAIQTQLDDIRDAAGTWHKATWAAADGMTKSIVHGLGSRDITVTIYDNNTYETIYVDSEIRTDTNTLDLTATQAPTGAGWRVLIRKI